MNQLLTSNKLKVIAIAAMFFDHFVAVFISHSTLTGLMLRTPGRIAAPIMCYFIAEGYFYTSDRKKYILRLLAFAVIAHIPYNLTFGYTFFEATSVIWSLAMGLVALTAVKSEKINAVLKIIILLACCLASYTANWNFVAVLWIVFFGIYHGDFKKQMISFCMIGIIFHLIPLFLDFGTVHEGYKHWYQFGIFLAIPLLAMYNGARGIKSKAIAYGFYIFYPLHLVILYLLDRYTLVSSYFI